MTNPQKPGPSTRIKYLGFSDGPVNKALADLERSPGFVRVVQIFHDPNPADGGFTAIYEVNLG